MLFNNANLYCSDKFRTLILAVEFWKILSKNHCKKKKRKWVLVTAISLKLYINLGRFDYFWKIFNFTWETCINYFVLAFFPSPSLKQSSFHNVNSHISCGISFPVAYYFHLVSVQFSSVAQPYLTLCNPMNCSIPGLPVHHQFLEFTETHVLWVSDAIQPSHPLSSPSPPAFNPSQHQILFKWVSSSHQVVKVLDIQLQHQSLRWIYSTGFL